MITYNLFFSNEMQSVLNNTFGCSNKLKCKKAAYITAIKLVLLVSLNVPQAKGSDNKSFSLLLNVSLFVLQYFPYL